jgi:hypothetical protein
VKSLLGAEPYRQRALNLTQEEVGALLEMGLLTPAMGCPFFGPLLCKLGDLYRQFLRDGVEPNVDDERAEWAGLDPGCVVRCTGVPVTAHVTRRAYSDVE